MASYYSAINAHDWWRAWNLGGRNFAASFGAFVAGYAHTMLAVVAIPLGASAATVPVRILAYTDSGQVQFFTGSYTANGGRLVSAAVSEQFAQSAAEFQNSGIATQIAGFGYTADTAHPHLGPNGLAAIPATCTGSGDGYCQKVFFYQGAMLIGVDTPQPDTNVSVVAVTGSTVVLAYPQYRPNDPMCCPNGGTATVTFHWNGHTITPSTPLPDPINGR